MKTHKDLDVWKRSIELVEEIYKITNDFPPSELYGIVSQIRRSAVSIASNIAEGSVRNYVKEYIQFLYISLGSLSELETQLIISIKLDYIKEFDFKKIEVIQQMLYGLIRYLKKKK